MRTVITAHRLREPVVGYSVLLRTAGTGSVDISMWLTDAEAADLAQQLALAAKPAAAEPVAEGPSHA